ncbi:MAG TPA: DinB family protein [Ktedonobacterales bacterium]|nr:DinB family protein [Ktedonobacterales bacterium]
MTAGHTDATLTAFAPEWASYQAKLIAALAPLTPAQLALRPAPGLRAIGQIARHVIGARSRWLHDFMPQDAAMLAEFGGWDRKDAPERTGAELADALTRTWQPLERALTTWTEPELSEHLASTDPDDPPNLSRRWILWHLIEHDLHHGGEISYVLGMNGLAAPDI